MNAMLQSFGEALDREEELPPGTVLLHGQYVVESYLVRGGFGITYLARDSLDRIVVIKECFPSAICCRVDGKVRARSEEQEGQFASVLRHFIREARRLSRLRHPDIVGVHQVFEERGTAYMALDYVSGHDLLTILEDAPERLTPALVQTLLRRTLEAVRYIHDQGILHRDISPDNILLGPTDNPTLIDFGAAREQATRENRALSALLTVKDGYSPQEFYLSDEPQRPSSDLYSLGATFYHVITGEAPPHSQQRVAGFAARNADPYRPLATRIPGYDPRFLASIDRALELFPDARFQSAEDWLREIEDCAIRQDSEAGDDGDDSIRRVISELIQEVSKEEADAPAGPETEASSPRGQKAVSAEPAQRQPLRPRFVDIFGNPIDDVDAWLKAQERDLNRREHEISEAEPCADSGAERGGFLRGILGRRGSRAAGLWRN
ncbi:serine/threonine protein kinase [Jhaorihella thermophila]|uniref:Protein kinase domain-containing protein n=1 Tax=Jhaorihella thermophila TaxID=488547 RepID=A0A1H5X978_9RHOB|nr:serine/threonine-protein kinase [Jhaorihella thermophila]SEG08298.1 hypothetical protein SAMN05421751_11056 [Jhaorihella thermophila]